MTELLVKDSDVKFCADLAHALDKLATQDCFETKCRKPSWTKLQTMVQHWRAENKTFFRAVLVSPRVLTSKILRPHFNEFLRLCADDWTTNQSRQLLEPKGLIFSAELKQGGEVYFFGMRVSERKARACYEKYSKTNLTMREFTLYDEAVPVIFICRRLISEENGMSPSSIAQIWLLL